MDLFRPFIIDKKKNQELRSRHPRFETPEAIFAASTMREWSHNFQACSNDYLELKGLLVECISHHDITSIGCIWHPAFLYTANALLADTTSPDWQFYFLLCVNCYAKVYDRFEFAEGTVQGLLAIAVDHGVISKDNAAILFRSLSGKVKSRQSSARQTGIWTADLTLAMRDREAASTAALAERFEAITIFDEFIEDAGGL